tara:strand:+ start:357 stop:815 length:459 start_codon:yes stop_codon:yes gene_type:complete
MTKFRDGFMMKSPLPAHGKLEKKLKKAKAGKIGSEQGDKDYELIADLESQIKEAKAKHRPMRREDDTLAKEDEDAARGSAAEMHTPLHNYGGYRGGADIGQYEPTADLYQKLFDKIESSTTEYHDRRDGTGAYAPDSDKEDDKEDDKKNKNQ